MIILDVVGWGVSSHLLHTKVHLYSMWTEKSLKIKGVFQQFVRTYFTLVRELEEKHSVSQKY